MKEFLSELRQQENEVMRRLDSISLDSEYITQLHRLYPAVPLVANKRCGSWYSPSFSHWCYFKSTDGHTGHWKFSLRRLNLHIASLNSCFIVDSTRKGKLFPDSFNSTIPLWCAVINYVCGFTTGQLVYASPSVPPQILSRMQDLVPQFARQFAESCGERLGELCLEKPLRPLFLCNPEIPEAGWDPDSLEYRPVVLVSASRRQEGAPPGYIQGAGDDEEFWCLGLTPRLFWDHREHIRCSEDVARIVEEAPDAEERRWTLGPMLSCGLGGYTEEDAYVIDTNSTCESSRGIHVISEPLCLSGKKKKRQVSSLLSHVSAWLQEGVESLEQKRVVVVGDLLHNVMAVAVGVLVLRSAQEPSKSSIRAAHNVAAEATGSQLPRNILKDLNRFFLSSTH